MDEKKLNERKLFVEQCRSGPSVLKDLSLSLSLSFFRETISRVSVRSFLLLLTRMPIPNCVWCHFVESGLVEIFHVQKSFIVEESDEDMEETEGAKEKVEPNVLRIEEHRRKYTRHCQETGDRRTECERLRCRAEAQAA